MTATANTCRRSQQQAALQLANEVRVANSHTVRAIKAQPYRDGLRQVADILRAGSDDATGRLPIVRLLSAPRHIGQVRVAALLRSAGILSGDRRLRELTRRQRLLLADQIARCR